MQENSTLGFLLCSSPVPREGSGNSAHTPLAEGTGEALCSAAQLSYLLAGKSCRAFGESGAMVRGEKKSHPVLNSESAAYQVKTTEKQKPLKRESKIQHNEATN